jgi:hypothetical protein
MAEALADADAMTAAIHACHRYENRFALIKHS